MKVLSGVVYMTNCRGPRTIGVRLGMLGGAAASGVTQLSGTPVTFLGRGPSEKISSFFD